MARGGEFHQLWPSTLHGEKQLQSLCLSIKMSRFPSDRKMVGLSAVLDVVPKRKKKLPPQGIYYIVSSKLNMAERIDTFHAAGLYVLYWFWLLFS
jgi:hypothetical protein